MRCAAPPRVTSRRIGQLFCLKVKKKEVKCAHIPIFAHAHHTTHVPHIDIALALVRRLSKREERGVRGGLRSDSIVPLTRGEIAGITRRTESRHNLHTTSTLKTRRRSRGLVAPTSVHAALAATLPLESSSIGGAATASPLGKAGAAGPFITC